ncbi:uncharacterized protein LOC123215474 [Mangifera indica]|uniref:uncharacterized protein LOC123215474 n=1 Tax=Mangifera indica TaxID=29780 RepID=UPI001CFA4847|nr:uncharacterized protein LOC123215474 [Mangifera indica]
MYQIIPNSTFHCCGRKKKKMDIQAKKGFFGNRKRRNICIVLGLTLILLILTIVILSFTVFKAKDPVITVDSVALDYLSVHLDIARVTVNINLTVAVNLTIDNPNKVGMKYNNTTSTLIYRGEEVGEIPIPAGEVSADESVHMSVLVTVMADRFMSNSQVFNDVVAGSLSLSSYTKITGKVSIFKIFKVHVTTVSECSFTVFISNRTTSDEQYRRRVHSNQTGSLFGLHELSFNERMIN